MTLTIDELWNSRNEKDWEDALDRYWRYIKPDKLQLEKFIQTLDIEWVKKLDSRQWYEFLRDKYFPWKYTAANRLASTTKIFRRYEDQGKLEYLFSIKKKIFDFNLAHIGTGLEIAGSIWGLGPAGASGLLAVLFPKRFGCTDQFVVKALCEVPSLPERPTVLAIKTRWKPGYEDITEKEAMLLIDIMRRKAQDLCGLFGPDKWTPRKVDMILWASRNGGCCDSLGGEN